MSTRTFTCFIFLINLTSLSSVYSQSINWRDYLEQMAEETEFNSTYIENLYEELLFLENNPINLNSATRYKLEQLPLLTTEEIKSIMNFLEKNRPLMTIFELRNVPNLDFKTIQLITPFFCVASLEEADKIDLKRGKHEIQFRFDKTLPSRAGYGEFSDSILNRYPNRKYQGEDFYTSLRYSFRYKDKIQAGLTAEKDAGEPFFKKNHSKGYDYYGVHLIIRDIGKLKTLALGDYRLSFGQGLILNNDFMGSKSWNVGSIAKRTIPPKRHFSTSESNYFKGISAQFQLGSFSITPFYSNKKIDANLSNNDEITSFKEDGLHRTLLEIKKKRNIRETVTGGNFNFRKHRYQIGLSGVYHEYNKLYNPSKRDYNLYYLRDFSNFNISVDYSFQLPGFIFAGETALAKNGSLATINSMQYSPSGNSSLKLLHRYYPITYNALYAQAFSENSRVQNENGLFIGADFKPFRHFFISSYIDFISFPWLKYGIDKPSKAVDYYVLANYALSRMSYLEVRYKYKQKEKNRKYPDKDTKTVLPYATHKIRLRYNHETAGGWGFRTTGDFALYSEKHSQSENGYMISQNISYRGNSRATGDLYLSWFDADTYNARIYSYERNLLSTFYMPSFYGKGIRLAFSAKYKITSNLTFSIKTGYTNYFNRDEIGSGTELIIGNKRMDIYTYLRWRF